MRKTAPIFYVNTQKHKTKNRHRNKRRKRRQTKGYTNSIRLNKYLKIIVVSLIMSEENNIFLHTLYQMNRDMYTRNN